MVRRWRRTTRQKGHGRREERFYFQSPLPASMRAMADDWSGLATVGQVVSITRRDGTEVSEVRYYVSSLAPGVKQFAAAVRGHWGIKNSPHWVLDMTFRKDHGADSFALPRRFAVSAIKQNTSPGSIRRK